MLPSMNASVGKKLHYQQLRWPTRLCIEKNLTAVCELVGFWESQWLSAKSNQGSAKCDVASSLSDVEKVAVCWRQYGDGKGSSFWIGLPKEPAQLIHDALVSEFSARKLGRQSGIVEDIAVDAWDDLLGAMIEMMKPSTPDFFEKSPPESELCPWSGAISILIPWCGVELALVLNSQCQAKVSEVPYMDGGVKAAPRDFGALKNLKDVIDPSPVLFNVTLTECELDLGTLRHLQLGDVIQLSHRLEDPLHVVTQSGENLCLGYLGKDHNLKAIELIAFGAKLERE